METDKEKKEAKEALDEGVKKCNEAERVWCMTNRDCSGEMRCFNSEKEEFFADEYQRCSGENGDDGACFCKRQKRAEGEKKMKEGHNKKAC